MPTFDLGGSPESLDCATATSTRSERGRWLLFDTLVRIGSSGRPIGLLANRIKPLAGNLAYEVTLRRDAVFSSGAPVTAGAVQYSIDRLRGAPRWIPELLPAVDGRDPAGRTCTLRFSYPDLLHILSEIDIHEPPSGADAAGGGRRSGIPPRGTGPYVPAGAPPAGCMITVSANPAWPAHPKKTGPHGDPGNYYPRRSVVYLGFNAGAMNRPFAAAAHRRGFAALLRGLNFEGIVPGRAADRSLNPLDPRLQAIRSPAPPPPAGSVPAPKETPPLVFAYNTGDVRSQQFADGIIRSLQGMGYAVSSPELGDFTALTDFLQRSDAWDMFLYTWHTAAPYPERILLPLLHPDARGTTNLTRIDAPALTAAMRDALGGGGSWNAVMTVMEEEAPLVFLYHPDLPTSPIPPPARPRPPAGVRRTTRRKHSRAASR